VATLRYTSYIPLALRTLSSIATSLVGECPNEPAASTTVDSESTPHSDSLIKPTTPDTPDADLQPSDPSATPLPLKISIVHRLGPVPIGQESIVIAVSSAHRTAAWRAAEAALEECKRRVEIWKSEVFAESGEAVWRENREWTGDGKRVMGGGGRGE
jgi:molybdopterin synthase catalytic subunit